MRLTTDIKADYPDEISLYTSQSINAYWKDLCLYPKKQRDARIAQLRQAAKAIPTGGAAKLLEGLQRRGYVS